MTYLSGIHGSLPIAQVLYGQSSPSGHLPFTYPCYEYQARDTIWQSQSAEYAPQWPFGFGLGYSQMVYSNLTVDLAELHPSKPITVHMTMCNAGIFDQHEPIMLYTTQSFCTGYKLELFHLHKFDKVKIKAGTVTSISFTLAVKELGYFNHHLIRVLGPLPVNITINALTPYEHTVTVNLAV
ncbi:hypothetical protein LPJ66_000948 [Kickxella alabastrina]|uniref:Uncharacterized protein n=1 Tax=Kickxella alabastrina TaxID=61397 RepID=A0ACC1IUK2_9FUNG|nr:hypothetical protein LPJ66_000948 [Kickxella alabastrina]